MEPLELKSIVLLHVLKDESKFCHLPLVYRNLCYRIKEHWNSILCKKSYFYRKHCVIGCRRWFDDMISYLEHRAFSQELDVIDEDIVNWCSQSYCAMPESDSDDDDYDDEGCEICGQSYQLRQRYDPIQDDLEIYERCGCSETDFSSDTDHEDYMEGAIDMLWT